jgi:hypothetical protein
MFWKAVAAGKFHVSPVAKVERGIEILIGMAAGKKNVMENSKLGPCSR